MKSLIIAAHPKKDGFSHKMAEQYKSGIEAKGGQAELIDLYDPANHLDFLSFDAPKDPKVAVMQQKITEADELVFLFPIWWFDAPAIMKNFLDVVFAQGFAFNKENGRFIPLLKGKTARIFVTSGGSSIFYWLLLNPTKKLWKYVRLGACGIKLKSYTQFYSFQEKEESERKKYLNSIFQLAQKG